VVQDRDQADPVLESSVVVAHQPVWPSVALGRAVLLQQAAQHCASGPRAEAGPLALIRFPNFLI
jgi:hypothetical protein